MLNRLFRRQDEASEKLTGQVDGRFEPHGITLATEETEKLARRSRVRIQIGPLLLIAILIVTVITLTGTVNVDIPPDTLARWPMVFVVLGAIWFLSGIVTGLPHGTLGGPVLVAIGLLAMQELPGPSLESDMLAGAVMIALGVAVLVRGLTQPAEQ